MSLSCDPYLVRRSGGDNLADVLERVLDTGLVVAGDIQVNLLDIELLTIKIRLLICSADKAEGLGMGWWRHDPFYTGRAALNGDVAARLERIEARLGVPDPEPG
ncbi:MAG TPA: gas vesicle protein [Acidimicrobiia bacterium]